MDNGLPQHPWGQFAQLCGRFLKPSHSDPAEHRCDQQPLEDKNKVIRQEAKKIF